MAGVKITAAKQCSAAVPGRTDASLWLFSPKLIEVLSLVYPTNINLYLAVKSKW